MQSRSIRAAAIRPHTLALSLALLTASARAQSAVAPVTAETKISDTAGGLVTPLPDVTGFGLAAAALGDLDGDGTEDVAVGAPGWDAYAGGVFILFLHPDGTVKNEVRIATGDGGFGGVLDFGDGFGHGVAAIGDLDQDGVVDLAVGAPFDDGGGLARGAVWIVFLKADGTVKAEQKISDTEGGFTGVLSDSDNLGMSLASVGDLDGDGTPELAAGAWKDDDGGDDRGAVWLLFLKPDGTVKSHRKISDAAGGFGGGLQDDDYFGVAIAPLGDLDGDGTADLAVGASGVSSGAHGVVWILFLHPDGSVKAEVEIGDATGGFDGVLDEGDVFGISLSADVDFDGDGLRDLVVGAGGDDDGGASGAWGANRGAVWILLLQPDGTVKNELKISALHGGFGGLIEDWDVFGRAVAFLGDLDGDGLPELAVGAFRDDDGGASGGPFGTGAERGALWILFLDLAPLVGTYGCAVNPAGSLAASGSPALGGAILLAVDNPLGTQSPGALSFVAFSFAPDAAFPCGSAISGLGMSDPGAPGELLLDVQPGSFLGVKVGPVWAGAGAPAQIALAMPPDPALLGLSVFAQGALLDAAPGAQVPLGLTEGLELLIGP